jgi:hypothetical protein
MKELLKYPELHTSPPYRNFNLQWTSQLLAALRSRGSVVGFSSACDDDLTGARLTVDEGYVLAADVPLATGRCVRSFFTVTQSLCWDDQRSIAALCKN